MPRKPNHAAAANGISAKEYADAIKGRHAYRRRVAARGQPRGREGAQGRRGRRRPEEVTAVAKTSEDAKFHAWLLTRKGATVTAVKSDPAWNAAVVRNAADRITGKTK